MVDKELHSPGKGSAVIRLKLKSLKTGNVIKEVLKTDDWAEEITVDHRPAQFLYRSGDQFVFMNPQTYEQYEVEALLVGDDEGFLKESHEYQLAIYEGKVIGVRMPQKMVLEVVESEESAKGNTATGSAATKPVKLETGMIVKVPLFIKKGEKIIVNTETKEYIGRKN